MLKSSSEDGYRQQCTIQTLQSDPKGCFGNLVQDIDKNNPNMMEDFHKCSTDEERIFFCTMLQGIDKVQIKPVFKEKNAELAKSKRNEGNAAFGKKWYKQAMMLYSMSAMKAPYPGPNSCDDTLAYAIANRSACLYHMGDMNHAIADARFALSLGYPDQLKYKLMERIAKCHLHLKQFDKAKVAVKDGQKCISNNKDKIDDKKLKAAVKSFAELMQNCVNLKYTEEVTVLDKEDVEDVIPKPPKLTAGANAKLIKEFSKNIKVEHKEGEGRHVVANKAVKAGDTLVVEDAFAAVLYASKQGTNCIHCFGKLRAAIPCQTCAGVCFCSLECREQATYHKYECQFNELVVGLGGSTLVLLSLRIVTSHPPDFFIKQRKELIVDPTMCKHKNSYQALHNLVGLEEQRWSEDLFNRSLMAVTLLKILKAARYFGCKELDPNVYNEDEVFIGALLLRHMQILQFNAHEVYEFLRGDKTKMKPCKNNLIGLGVYPSASYFNHSCHPGTTRYYIGKKMVLKALTPVKPGSEVYENYGPTFYFKGKKERQDELKGRYWFNCGCPACCGDWPLLKQTNPPKWKQGLKVSNAESAADDLKTVFSCGVDFMEHGQEKDAAECLEEYVNEMYELVDPPLENLLRAEDKLRTCYNAMGSVIFSDTVLKSNPAEKSENPMIK